MTRLFRAFWKKKTANIKIFPMYIININLDKKKPVIMTGFFSVTFSIMKMDDEV